MTSPQQSPLAPSQQQQHQQSQQSGSGGGGSSSSAASLLIDGDGILTQLFYFIWRMKCSAVAAAGGGSTTTGTYNPLKPPKTDDPSIQAVMDLCIPSTVILEHNFPKFWYARSADFEDDEAGTTSAARASIMNSAPPERRTGKDIDSASIIRAFRAPEGGSGPVPGGGGGGGGGGSPLMLGSARSGDDSTDKSGAMLPGPGDVVASYYAEATDDEGRACTRVEFLDSDGVKSLLIRRTRRPDGILQCFVCPCGKQNSVVQVVWSPHIVHVTRRRNRFPLRDTRLPLYDRCTTFEGLAHYSDEVFVAPHIRLQANLVCEELVRSFRDVHRVNIQRMVLYFKPDSAGRLWFLFGNSLRVAVRIPKRMPSAASSSPNKGGGGNHNNSGRKAAAIARSEMRPVTLSLRGMKPQERMDAEHNQSARLAKMLVEEAFEVHEAHEKHSKMQEYFDTHKKLRQAAKEEPLIRALVGTPLAPYARYRPQPPSLGPIGDTYYPAPRPASVAAAAAAAALASAAAAANSAGAGDNRGDVEGGDAFDAVSFGGGPPHSPASTQAERGGGSSSPQQQARPRSSIANLTRLVSKIKTANALSPPQQRLLSTPLSCIVPPLYGATGTLSGGSLAMFSNKEKQQQDQQQEQQQQIQQHSRSTSDPFGSSSGAFLSEQQRQQYAGRSSYVLWQIVRLAVFSGAIRTVALRTELREFIKSTVYGLYSHFSSEAVLVGSNTKTSAAMGAKGQAPAATQQRPFRLVVPQTYFAALGEGWWNELGFSQTRLVKVSQVAVLIPPPLPPRKKTISPDQQPGTAAAASAASAITPVLQGRGGSESPGPQQQQQQMQHQHETEHHRCVTPAGAYRDDDEDDAAGGATFTPQQNALDCTVGAVASSPVPKEGNEASSPDLPFTPSGAILTMGNDQNNNDNDEMHDGSEDSMGQPLDAHQLALRHYTQEQIDERAKRIIHVPLTAHPDDMVLEVAGLAAPLLHVQAKMNALMRSRVDLPAAKVRFFYAAHRVIQERKRSRKFANIVRQTWLQHKSGMSTTM